MSYPERSTDIRLALSTPCEVETILDTDLFDSIDIARGIYVNSTMEKLSLIRMLKDHESARRSSEHEVEKAWMNRVDVSDT